MMNKSLNVLLHEMNLQGTPSPLGMGGSYAASPPLKYVIDIPHRPYNLRT